MVNSRAHGPSDVAVRSADDLTARARIIAAAVDQFAANGYEATTMKAIADHAGVSVGLIQHHFDTKAGLHKACDQRAIEVLLETKLRAFEDGTIGTASFMAEFLSLAPPTLRYLSRALAESSPTASELFAQIVTGTEEVLTSRWPDRFTEGSQERRDVATAIGAMQIGAVVLHPLVAERMSLTPWEDIAHPRIGAAMVEAYTTMGEFLQSPLGEQLQAAVRSTGEDNRPA